MISRNRLPGLVAEKVLRSTCSGETSEEGTSYFAEKQVESQCLPHSKPPWPGEDCNED